MSKFELIYFDAVGRGEHIRMCMNIAKKDFIDTRFVYTDWPKIKPTTPLGSVPVLKVDGIQHCQSVSLARYAGRLAGWYPEDPLEALVVDEAMESMNELMGKCPRAKDQDEMKKLRKEFQNGTFQQYVKFLEGLIQQYGNDGCGFVKTPTVADLSITFLVTDVQNGQWDYFDTDVFESYPGILATVKSTLEHPDVIAYKKSKEETESK